MRGTIRLLERMNSSVNGNPRFRVTFETEDGEIRALPTQPDAMWSYGAENPEYRNALLEFTLTPSGKNIAYAKPVES